MTQDPRLASHFENIQKEQEELSQGYKELNARHDAFNQSKSELRAAIMAIIAELGKLLVAVSRSKVAKY